MARLLRNVGAGVQIVLLGVGAAVTYGILHDQITAHVCVEYFTIGHVDYFNLGDPALIAIEWGIIATWWTGLLLGVPVAFVARIGTRRPAVSARDLLRPTLMLMGCIGIVALVAGVTGYLVARAGGVYLTEPLASAVPRAKHVAFLADLWAHDAAYAAGVPGCVALCIWTWRRRGALRRAQPGIDPRVFPPSRQEGVSVHSGPTQRRWEAIALRLLLIIGGVSPVLGLLFVLVLSMLWGL